MSPAPTLPRLKLSRKEKKQLEMQEVWVKIQSKCTHPLCGPVVLYTSTTAPLPRARPCPRCSIQFHDAYDSIKEELKEAEISTVKEMIHSSCLADSSGPGDCECCDICAQRLSNMKDSVREFRDMKRLACDAFVERWDGVPRLANVDGKGGFKYEYPRKFEGNYALLYAQMVYMDASQLKLIRFPYATPSPKSKSRSMHLPKSQSLMKISKDISKETRRMSRLFSDKIEDAKDATEDFIHELPSMISTTASNTLNRLSEKVKDKRHVSADNHFRSRAMMGRMGNRASLFMDRFRHGPRNSEPLLLPKTPPVAVSSRSRFSCDGW